MFKLTCIMLGHDDRVRRGRWRIYLECENCGRQTPGWDLSDRAIRPARPGTRVSITFRPLRELLRQLLRDPLHAVGLR